MMREACYSILPVLLLLAAWLVLNTASAIPTLPPLPPSQSCLDRCEEDFNTCTGMAYRGSPHETEKIVR